MHDVLAYKICKNTSHRLVDTILKNKLEKQETFLICLKISKVFEKSKHAVFKIFGDDSNFLDLTL